MKKKTLYIELTKESICGSQILVISVALQRLTDTLPRTSLSDVWIPEFPHKLYLYIYKEANSGKRVILL